MTGATAAPATVVSALLRVRYQPDVSGNEAEGFGKGRSASDAALPFSLSSFSTVMIAGGNGDVCRSFVGFREFALVGKAQYEQYTDGSGHYLRRR